MRHTKECVFTVFDSICCGHGRSQIKLLASLLCQTRLLLLTIELPKMYNINLYNKVYSLIGCIYSSNLDELLHAGSCRFSLVWSIHMCVDVQTNFF